MNMVDELKQHDNDTGSPEVQIAMLTEDIEAVAKHLRKHRKDNSSRKGLLRMLWRRRRLLIYLRRLDSVKYESVLEVIGMDE